MSKFIPSKYQQALFDWIKTGTGSAIVEAVAGSGKTTSMVQSLNMIDPKNSILFLAFNKSIAEELKSRAPEHVICMTMNALGHRAVMKQFGRVQLDAHKTSMIIDSMVDAGILDENDAKYNSPVIKKLVGIAKSVGLVPATASDKISLVEDTLPNWDALIQHHDIEFGSEEMSREMVERIRSNVIEWTRIALQMSINETKVIDFNDQLYFPVIYGLSMPTHDWVFVDEAQDISAIQRALLVKALKRNGRLIAVGDPAQAIYGFRGADSDSLKNIAKTFNCITLPLSISYRCPKAVVREAQRFVKHIEASDTAPEGSVTDLGAAQPEMFKINDMVVCRNSAPIIQLAYMLISKKIPAKVMGRDIGEGLINLTRKLRARSLIQLEERLEAWMTREVTKLLEKDPEADVTRIVDKYECLKCFIDHSGANTVEELIVAIQQMFGDNAVGTVVLSTIHKAKGLEAKRVFILDAWRMPSKYARKPHQIEQEFNLFYVAVTRAQEELFYVTSSELTSLAKTALPSVLTVEAPKAAVRKNSTKSRAQTISVNNALKFNKNYSDDVSHLEPDSNVYEEVVDEKKPS